MLRSSIVSALMAAALVAPGKGCAPVPVNHLGEFAPQNATGFNGIWTAEEQAVIDSKNMGTFGIWTGPPLEPSEKFGAFRFPTASLPVPLVVGVQYVYRGTVRWTAESSGVGPTDVQMVVAVDRGGGLGTDPSHTTSFDDSGPIQSTDFTMTFTADGSEVDLVAAVHMSGIGQFAVMTFDSMFIETATVSAACPAPVCDAPVHALVEDGPADTRTCDGDVHARTLDADRETRTCDGEVHAIVEEC